ncbi:MAG: methyl-accepting chemotaxis protein [Alphaproteobacteria bacterium]|nr:methyl-accepting chemotaxis protein [Alphaproteobacteria bacterium]
MSIRLSAIRLAPKTIAVTIGLLVGSIALVSAVTFYFITEEIKKQVIDRQAGNLRAAASVMSDAFPDLKVSYDRDGNVTRLELPAIPHFASHEMIDKIGRISGETATVFAFEPENGDFWRRTTNIIKPDGARAVGTQLGVNGAVHPVVSRGETFLGEAVILGEAYYTIYEPIFDPSGQVIGILYAGVLKSELQHLMTKLSGALALAALAVVLLSGLIGFFAFRRMLRPIPVLAGLMTDLAENRSKDVTIPYQDRADETGDMARALKVFRESMAESARQAEENAALRDKQVEAERAAEAEKRRAMADLAERFEVSVGGIAERLSASAGALQKASDEMTQATEGASDRTTATAGAVEEAADSVNAVASASEQLSGSIREISAKVSESSAVAQSAVDEVDRTRETVAALSKAADEIGGVIQLINDIAEQTNLLALNATIEAARAGEAGKGFAVVATEVKSLAEQTGRATEQIASQIQAMQTNTHGTVDAMQSVGGTIGRINEIASAIAAAVEEQTAATENISTNASQAAAGASAAADGVASLRETATELGDSAGGVKTVSDDLASDTRALKREVEDFLAQIRAG